MTITPFNMKAISIIKPGDASVLKVSQVPLPEKHAIPPGHVLIRNHFAGVNYIDIYQRSGKYPLPTPFILGRYIYNYVQPLRLS